MRKTKFSILCRSQKPRRWRCNWQHLLTAGLLLMSACVVCNAQSPASSKASVPNTVDLRRVFDEFGLERWQQGGRPTCSAFTVAGALEFAVAKRQGHGTRLSVEFLNWAANKTCGDAEDGGFFSDLWKGFEAYGICTAQDLPYQRTFNPSNRVPPEAFVDAKTRMGLELRFNWIKEWNVNTGLIDSQLFAIKQTLNAGWPVCGGFRWPKKEEWVNDVLQMCPSNAVRDGHSVLLVSYRDEAAQLGGGVFIFRNTAKQGRDGFMPYGYAQAYMNDAAWIDYQGRGKVSAASTFAEPRGSVLALPAGRNGPLSSNEQPKRNDAPNPGKSKPDL